MLAGVPKKKNKKGRTLPMAERHRRSPQVFHPSQGVRTLGADDGEPMPEVAEHLIATPMHYEGETVTLHVPTPALIKISEIASKEGLERALPDWSGAPLAERLYPSGQHALAELTRVTGEDGTDFVRAFARLFLKDDAKLSPLAWQGWIDLPTRYVGMMLEASKPREDERYANRQVAGVAADGTPQVKTHLGHARPTWAGSWTFDKVYSRQLDITSLSANNGAKMNREGRILVDDPKFVLATQAIGKLASAHLIRIEADQVELLPDWEEPGDAGDFAADAGLPFDPLYFEFEGAGGVAPTHEVELGLVDRAGEVGRTVRGAMVLRGALVWRGESSNLTVEPYGDVYLLGEGESFRKARERASLTDPRVAAGRVVFGHQPFEPATEEVGTLRIVALDGAMREVAESHPVALDAAMYTKSAVSGVVVLPFSELYASKNVDGETAVGWGAVVLSMAMRVLACLSIMESEAVVVDDAPMESRDRKRADKRGWQISQQVFVRPTRKGPRSEPTGNEREYSHRFWVSGHYKHFPLGTRMADRRPDLVSPCTRAGDASCGVCRRLWTPPFIKGPDDKPLVVKALVKRRVHA